MSDRASTGSPCACSGDMYGAVPVTTPCSVMVTVGASAARLGCSLARPKSSTFTLPSVVSRMLSGFRSRWTIPALWAAASASQT